MESYLAHIQRDPSDKIIAVQSVSKHCHNTARYAAAALEPVGLSAAGEAVGLLHDLGKYSEQFQDYIKDGAGTRGSVNHTFAGVRLLLERYHHEPPEDLADIAAELLALAVGGHHGGLFDCVDDQQKNGFRHRLTKKEIGYEEARDNFFRFCINQEELDQQFQAALNELTPVLEHICAMTGEEVSDERYDQETAFYSGLLARLLLSAVIEGDRRDTAISMNGAAFPPARSGEELEQMWFTLLTRTEEKLNAFSSKTPIDQARRMISNQCGQAAEQAGGVFRLSVPTGGGKTLSGLRFALAHARKYRKQRIIFTSPLLSILDQNAKEIRKYIQDDSLILEHHSNLVRTEENSEQLDERELLTETWEAPVIITTLVQLLNILFSGKTTCIRRFHSLCNSVIVIDEVQTVPSKMLSMFSLAVNFLAEICGVTVVLCSATQPCTEQIEHPIHGPIRDIVPYDPALWQVFQRTDIQSVGSMSLEQIADFAVKKLEHVDSLLIVCNKKNQSEHLYSLLKDKSFALFSLSAAMCVTHRRDTLNKLKSALGQSSQKTVCVSTQVIEAGVDISFGCVIRLSAGMDSVVQAAGRCNRSGEAGPGVLAPVYLVECQQENLSHLPDIQLGKDATQELIAEFAARPEQFQHRLDSDASIEYYYRALYRREPAGHHDYCVKDRPSLFSLLSLNGQYAQEHPYYFNQAFRLAGTLFEVFEENTTDVVVPYKESEALIAGLCSEKAQRDPFYLRSLLEAAKPYTVSLYQYQIDRLNEEHSLIPLQGGALGLSGHYSAETGFSMGESKLEFLWR